jgi:hypothetical protein
MIAAFLAGCLTGALAVLMLAVYLGRKPKAETKPHVTISATSLNGTDDSAQTFKRIFNDLENRTRH